MRKTSGRCLLVLVVATCSAPATAHADSAWTCSAAAGWLSAGQQRVEAPGIGASPCPMARADTAGAAGAAGSLTATGTLSADGGGASQTTDSRKPQSAIDARSLAIQNADGSLVLTASKLSAQALGVCDAHRQPLLTSAGSPGSVTLNGRAIDTGSDYSEPGVGVNGAPLFGKITVRFNEVARAGDTGLTRRAIHLVVTDRDGVVVFEAVAGEVAVGRSGAVCDPPPVCPPGQEPQAGRCVDVTVTPLPQPPPPAPPLAAPLGGQGTQPPSRPGGRHRAAGCKDARARVGDVSERRLQAATFCLMNAERGKRHIGKLRASADLGLAATRHARDMVTRRYFAHDEPAGPSVVDRILRSGYLQRYGSWRIGENLGWGWGRGGTPAAIVAAWMRSAPHRRNIMNRRFHDAGVAVRQGTPGGKRRGGSVTYVIDFGGFD
jgi:uncharacterized protein YkwD